MSKTVVIGIIAVAFLLGIGAASALLQVSATVYNVDDPTIWYSQVIKDGQFGDDDGIVNGEIDINSPYTPIPGFSVQGSFHTSKMAGWSLLTSAESTVTNSNAYPVRAYVVVSDTDFTSPATLASVTGSATFTGATGSTMHMGFYDDPENVQGADRAFSDLTDFNANFPSLTPGNLIFEDGFTAADEDDSFSLDEDNIVVSDPSPYSMAMVFDFTLEGPGFMTGHAQSMQKNVASVPEFPTFALPAGMVIGLVGAILLIRRTKED
jgi:hypothetical protein